VLGTEGRGDLDTANVAQRVQRMFEIRGHRRRMGQQGHAPPLELTLQIDVA
jgi:hypothetical protein